MKRNSSSQAGLAVLAFVWLIGCGLWAAPSEIGDAVRAPVRDGLRPGHVLFADVLQSIEARWLAWRFPSLDDELAALRAERDAWRDQFVTLQASMALQGADTVDRPGDSLPPLAGASSDPLAIPDLVPATILGVERDALRERVSRLLDRGTTDGIAVDDVVLAGPLPLLDQGDDAAMAPDMPVLAGGCVVGRIKQTGRWTSTVEPVSDPEFRGYVQLVRTTRQGPLFGAEGVLAGNGDGSCRVELIAATEPVSVGDFVYGRMPGTGPVNTLCYGRVTVAELPEGAAHWQITVAPLETMDSSRTVQVLRELPNPARMASRIDTPK